MFKIVCCQCGCETTLDVKPGRYAKAELTFDEKRDIELVDGMQVIRIDANDVDGEVEIKCMNCGHSLAEDFN